MSDPGWVKFTTSGSTAIWSCGGAWTIEHATRLDGDLTIPAEAISKTAILDLSAIDQLDTSGANFHVIGLQDDAALLRPIGLQLQDERLETGLGIRFPDNSTRLGGHDRWTP